MNQRVKGKLIEWQDDRGFGFVQTPQNGGTSGQRVFVHIKQLRNQRRRPRVGDTLSFEQLPDARGNPSAIRVTLHGGWWSAGVLFALLFLLALCGVTLLRLMPDWLLGAYLLMSVITFISYARDKSAALKGRWRISELSLQLQALLCGWPGALLARHCLRHKSSKTRFSLVLYLMLLLNIALLIIALLAAGGYLGLDKFIH
ncbi:DUF1294 domain-containing protein [Shewanella sp. GXUN23E]|uniref:DUF1294 domain-containing protein n=1 Tax=Shewanella sp. GXUN23E TaxID=3422498 RepID=UPI003D7EB519